MPPSRHAALFAEDVADGLMQQGELQSPESKFSLPFFILPPASPVCSERLTGKVKSAHRPRRGATSFPAWRKGG